MASITKSEARELPVRSIVPDKPDPAIERDALVGKKKTPTAAKKEHVTPAPKPAQPKTLHAEAGGDWRDHAAVRVRMYRHGLGDCFLLAFPTKTDGKDFKILIDCGVILGTPNGSTIIKQVVEDLKHATDEGGTPTIDVLVATHEHWDHVSGFGEVHDEFAKFQIGQVWLAWTEDPKNTEANELRNKRKKNLKALQLGVAHLQNQLKATGGLGVDGKSGPAAEDYRRAAEILTFFGIDPEKPTEDLGGLGAAATGGKSKLGLSAAMDWCRTHSGAKFWSPGQVIEVDEVKGLHVYVLGPPTDRKQLMKPLPTKSGKETYDSLQGFQLASTARAFFGADVELFDTDDIEAEFDGTTPFDNKYRIDMDRAATIDFFKTHYYGTGSDDAAAWRRIDGNSLEGASEFALQLDSDTNNTSLALAFELPDERVLLFAADAQVGNWESWHADSTGKKLVWKIDGKEVTAEELLNRTVLYKTGHHGSHNATLRDKGLEMMTDKRLVALVPVDTYIAHEKKNWGQMPFNPLLAALRTHANGRVIEADQPIASLPAGTFPDGEAVDSTATITVAGPKDKQIVRPLYVDFFVPKG